MIGRVSLATTTTIKTPPLVISCLWVSIWVAMELVTSLHPMTVISTVRTLGASPSWSKIPSVIVVVKPSSTTKIIPVLLKSSLRTNGVVGSFSSVNGSVISSLNNHGSTVNGVTDCVRRAQKALLFFLGNKGISLPNRMEGIHQQHLSTNSSQTLRTARRVLGNVMKDSVQLSNKNCMPLRRGKRVVSFQGSAVRFVQTSYRISLPAGNAFGNQEKVSSKILKDKKTVPDSDPPSDRDVDLLYQFFDQSTKLVVLTGAGISTECGIPDYRSPNGAYSSGFRPITHQEFVRSSRTRRRYWARSYAGWRRFHAAEPSAAHFALASLEKAGRIDFMITQNVDRLHHRAGSNPLEIHGTVYSVTCLDCNFSFPRSSFQDQLKALNPKWAEAIESLDNGSPGSEKSFGMKQRPDGDIEIDEKFWEEDYHIPACPKCNGVLKPDVVFFGDNVPKDRADKAMEAAKGCDAFLVLGSSLMTMSAFRLVRAAHEAGAATAIVNLGVTRADDIVPLKINARLGEILPRVLNIGSLSIPALS